MRATKTKPFEIVIYRQKTGKKRGDRRRLTLLAGTVPKKGDTVTHEELPFIVESVKPIDAPIFFFKFPAVKNAGKR